jgi:DNA-binding transcriptional regulator YhcF (GntR family)
MCHFITAILPAGAELNSLRRLARDHALALNAIHNPHVEAQLQPGERYYLTTLGGCDCGTILGSHRRQDRRSHAKQPKEREVAALRRRGWSDAKVERWLSQRTVTASRDARVRQVYAQSDALDAGDWQQFIAEVLASGSAFIGLLLHWYSGTIDGERIQISRRHSITAADITPDFLTQLSEDELYVFTP